MYFSKSLVFCVDNSGVSVLHQIALFSCFYLLDSIATAPYETSESLAVSPFVHHAFGISVVIIVRSLSGSNFEFHIAGAMSRAPPKASSPPLPT